MKPSGTCILSVCLEYNSGIEGNSHVAMSTLSSVTLFFCATAANAAAVLSTDARPIRMLTGAHAAGSGAVAYEWAGVFQTPQNTYTWIAEATGAAAPYTYADATMDIVLLSVTAATRLSLHAEEGEGNHSFSATCQSVASGGTITPGEDQCYTLTFNDTNQRSTFTIDATNAPNLAIFTQHVPTEFEINYHYLQQGAFAATNPDDVEPEYAFNAPQTFEWGGIFAVPDASYTWYAQKKVSSATSLAYDYADGSMDVVMLPVADDSEEALLASMADADHSWEDKTACTVVNSGDSIVPLNDTCFVMTFDDAAAHGTSTFTIDTSAPSTNYVAVWAQHMPTEFERDLHYFKNATFADVEPAHTYPVVARPQKKWRWGEIIGSAILVNLMTLAGVCLMVPFLKKRQAMFECVMLSFAGGAILSFTFYLILPEAPHYIEGGHQGADELEVTWRYGSVVLAGYLSGWFADTLGSIFSKEEEVTKPDGTKDIDGSVHSANVKRRVIVGCLVGDGLHNLIDGFLIAFAFQWCSSSRGWQIAAATIGHELAQEIADYSILTLKAGLKPITALSFNFISGTTVLLGAIIATAGKPSNETMGLITAFGGGAYIFIAQESMSRVFNMELAGPKALIPFFAFIVGVVAIALVLVDHTHCSESTAQAALSIAAGLAVDPHGH